MTPFALDPKLGWPGVGYAMVFAVLALRPAMAQAEPNSYAWNGPMPEEQPEEGQG